MQNTISTPQPLHAAFAHGWRFLPTELKADVLSYLLPRDTTFDGGTLYECVRREDTKCPRCGGNHHHYTGVQSDHWLASLINIPDFTDIGVDLLLAHNTLEIHAEFHESLVPALIPFSHCIQKLVIIVYTKWHHWKWLAETLKALSSNRFQSVELMIDGWQAYDDSAELFMREIKLVGRMVVRTKRLVLSSRNWEEIDGGRWRVLPDTGKLTELIRKNLTKNCQ